MAHLHPDLFRDLKYYRAIRDFNSRGQTETHFAQRWTVGSEVLLDTLQSSVSFAAYVITDLCPKVCNLEKPWKAEGRRACGNTKLPLITCYLFNINSLQKNTNKSLTPTPGIHKISEDIFRQMYDYQQPLSCAEITSLWQGGRWEEAVCPKRRVVNFDWKGNYITNVCCFGHMAQWLWTCKSAQHKTAQQVNFWWPVTDAGPQITSHQDGLEDPLSMMLRYTERKPYQGKSDRIKWLIWCDDIVIKG